MTTSPDSVSEPCVSCGAALTDEYCAHCGEERFTPEKRTLRHFFGHIVGTELLNFDGKVWRTMRPLLTRPGFLTQEYARGRRRPYLHPFRILLFAIIAYALTGLGGGYGTFTFQLGTLNLNMVPMLLPGTTLDGALSRIDRNAVIEPRLENKVGLQLNEIPDDVSDRYLGVLSALANPLSFTVVILMGLLLFLLFNRRRPFFVEHLAFAMHYYGFVLIAALLGIVLVRVPGMPFAYYLLIAASQLIWQMIYLAFGVRRFYLPTVPRRYAWPAATAAAMLLVILSGFFITAVQLASGLIAVWLL